MNKDYCERCAWRTPHVHGVCQVCAPAPEPVPVDDATLPLFPDAPAVPSAQDGEE